MFLFFIVQLPQNKRAVVAVLGGHFAIEEIFCEYFPRKLINSVLFVFSFFELTVMYYYRFIIVL